MGNVEEDKVELTRFAAHLLQIHRDCSIAGAGMLRPLSISKFSSYIVNLWLGLPIDWAITFGYIESNLVYSLIAAAYSRVSPIACCLSYCLSATWYQPLDTGIRPVAAVQRFYPTLYFYLTIEYKTIYKTCLKLINSHLVPRRNQFVLS